MAFAGPTMTTRKVSKAIPRLQAFCRLLPPAFVRLPIAMQAAAEVSQLMCDRGEKFGSESVSL